MEIFCENCKSSTLLPDDIEDDRVECPTCGETIPILSQSPSAKIHQPTTSWGQSARRQPKDKNSRTMITPGPNTCDTRLSPKAPHKQPEIVCPSCGVGTLIQDDWVFTCNKCHREWYDVEKRERKKYSRRQSKSIQYAPYDTCPYCGWTGKDWGFKYHRSCTPCYNRWRKKKAQALRELRELEYPNEHVQVAPGIIVTRNVHKRLKRRAYNVPHSKAYYCAGTFALFSLILGLSCFLVLIWCLDKGHFLSAVPLGVTAAVLAWTFFAAIRVQETHERERGAKIEARLEELARERQHRIDETNAFYASAEWRLIRQKVIEEQGQVCSQCQKEIIDEFDLTVDHIKPRSKFPDLALELSNLQVLCRSCNSAKSNTTSVADPDEA